MLGTPAKATVWLVTYTHKAGEGRERHRELFLTSDPTGSGLYEVVRAAVPKECRPELVIVEATRHGEAAGAVTLVPLEGVAN
jgi:hypothetical protein